MYFSFKSSRTGDIAALIQTRRGEFMSDFRCREKTCSVSAIFKIAL